MPSLSSAAQWSHIRDEGALVFVGDGLTAVVLGQAAPDAMGLVGGECVERARHPDGTPRTDRLGRRLPLTLRGFPLAIRPKEQRTREISARGGASHIWSPWSSQPSRSSANGSSASAGTICTMMYRLICRFLSRFAPRQPRQRG